MNIQARITSRKILLSYIYAHLLAYYTSQKEDVSLRLFFDLEKENEDEQKDSVTEEDIATLDSTEHFLTSSEYILREFFSYRFTPKIDPEYLEAIGSKAFSYWPEVQKMVDEHTNTFGINRMDIMDQSLFLLGYAEWKVLGTPKEILLNEIVELGKRYGDDGSAKLLNGILHKLIDSA